MVLVLGFRCCIFGVTVSGLPVSEADLSVAHIPPEGLKKKRRKRERKKSRRGQAPPNSHFCVLLSSTTSLRQRISHNFPLRDRASVDNDKMYVLRQQPFVWLSVPLL